MKRKQMLKQLKKFLVKQVLHPTKYPRHQHMTKDIAGGINARKKTYPKVAGGDNPMALEDEKDLTASIKETLLLRLRRLKKKTRT